MRTAKTKRPLPPDEFMARIAGLSKRTRAGYDVINEAVRYVPTRFPGLNRVMAQGSEQKSSGIPLGTAGIIHGAEHTGKTSFLAGVAASFQDAGGYCYYVDAEGVLVKSWFWRLGVNPDRFWYHGRFHEADRPKDGKDIPPLYYEDARNAVDKLIGAYREECLKGIPRGPLLVVVDSLPALIPRDVAKRIDATKGDFKRGMLGMMQASCNTSWAAELGPKIVDFNIFVMFVEHTADAEPDRFGNKMTKIKGGRFLRTNASVIAETKFAGLQHDVAKKEGAEGWDDRPVTAKKHRILVQKNKIGSLADANATTFEFFVSTAQGKCPLGYDRPRELVNEASRRGLIDLEWDRRMELTLGVRFKLGKQGAILKDLYHPEKGPPLMAALQELLQ